MQQIAGALAATIVFQQLWSRLPEPRRGGREARGTSGRKVYRAGIGVLVQFGFAGMFSVIPARGYRARNLGLFFRGPSTSHGH
jgi:hypothetical protein